MCSHLQSTNAVDSAPARLSRIILTGGLGSCQIPPVKDACQHQSGSVGVANLFKEGATQLCRSSRLPVALWFRRTSILDPSVSSTFWQDDLLSRLLATSIEDRRHIHYHCTVRTLSSIGLSIAVFCRLPKSRVQRVSAPCSISLGPSGSSGRRYLR